MLPSDFFHRNVVLSSQECQTARNSTPIHTQEDAIGICLGDVV